MSVSKRTVYIRFFSGVNAHSINNLISIVDQKLKEGVNEFVILISSGGGTVFHGLSAYNYLVGIPAKIITHNFGTVDSIACVLFCAGSTRYSVPHARFLLHGVATSFPQGASLEEPQLEERLKGLKIDIENIAKVIGATTNKTKEQIVKALLERTTLNPEQAKEFGLVHEIKASLIEAGAELIPIDQPQ